MGQIRKSRTLFFTTSPRSPVKLIPEINLLIENFNGQKWLGNKELQENFAKLLAASKTFEGYSSKKHSAFSARDRITRSPQGLGLVDLSPKIALTAAGKAFASEMRSSEVFFRQLLKYQLPSPFHIETARLKGTFYVHPFLEIIRLIRAVDHLTPDEFRIFALQLTDYRKFDTIKRKVEDFRCEKKRNMGNYKQFIDAMERNEISEIYAEEIKSGNINIRQRSGKTSDINDYIKKQAENMRDYSDACFRYLRYTEMFESDGKSIRIAPGKCAEIDFALKTIDREPKFVDDVAKYKEYLFNPLEPILFTDNKDNIVDVLMRDFSFSRRELSDKTIDQLKDMRDSHVQKRREALVLEEERSLKSYALYQEVIDTYNEILSDDVYDAPLFLEWNTWRAMTMLDGGSIKGNFKIDDGGKPISTAQGNMPDIECDYEEFVLSVEVTLQRGQRQYESEGEPITRHYAKMQEKYRKEAYCLFIAPSISRATWAHFFGLNQIANISAYGGKPRIIPIELDQFMRMIENSYSYNGNPGSNDVLSFLKSAITQIKESSSEDDWRDRIRNCASTWLVNS